MTLAIVYALGPLEGAGLSDIRWLPARKKTPEIAELFKGIC